MDLSEAALMRHMSESQRTIFSSQMAGQRKSETTGVLLALFLGGVGAHHFYMGNIGLGVIYLLFCWTFIPVLIALIEVFMMPGRVRRHNARKAGELAAMVKTLS